MTILKLTYNLPVAYGLEINFPIKVQNFTKVKKSLDELFSTYMRQDKILPLKKMGIYVKIQNDSITFWKRKGYYFSPSISPRLVIDKSGVLVLQSLPMNINNVNFYEHSPHFNDIYKSQSFENRWKIVSELENCFRV